MEFVGLLVVEDAGSGDASTRPSRAVVLDLIANRPIAHHVLDVFASCGVSEVIVASSTAHAQVVRDCLSARNAGVRFTFVEKPAPVDVAGALRLAAPIIGAAPCIAHVAGGLLSEPFAPFLDHALGESSDVVLFLHRRPSLDGGLSAATQAMLHIAELDPQVPGLGIAGVSLFGPGTLQSVAEAPWNEGHNTDLTDIVDAIVRTGGRLQVRLVDAWWCYRGDPAILLELNRTALDRLKTDGRRPDTAGNRIEGRVRIDESACVQASVIIGPAVIGPGAHISDAYVGPYTSVGPGAQIRGAEIERSIISAGASITHVGGRLAGSVIGPDARIFCDFSLPRALRMWIGEGTEVALC